MIEMTLRDVIKITGGKLLGGYDELDSVIITKLVQDSRKAEPGKLFIPYKGGIVDGHDFTDEALKNGCIGCLTDELPDSLRNDRFYILVDDVIDAVWKMVEFRRSMLSTKIVCVTGSVGKTTTTAMTANVLRQRYKVFETSDNWNDEFLAPIMLFDIDEDDECAVIELGIGYNSSVSKMARFIRPDAIVITNIGYAHIGKTGSLEATRDEKCGTEDGLPDSGIAIINGDDSLIMSYPFKHSTVTFGKNPQNDTCLADIPENVPDYEKYAALAAAAVGKCFSISDSEIRRGIETYTPAKGRMDIVRKNGFTLIDSSFNASLASIENALKVLSKFDGTKVAVFSDMLEIGDMAETLHVKVGELAAQYGVDILIAIGERSHDVLIGSNISDDMKDRYAFRTIDEAIPVVAEIANSCTHPTILCKGSHGSGVYQIADMLRAVEA